MLLNILEIQAKKWQTRSQGYWNNGEVWDQNEVPKLESRDSIIISHPVVLQSDFILPENSYGKIEPKGGLCGHFTFKILSGATFELFGLLETDTLRVEDGKMTVFSGGKGRFSHYGKISGVDGSFKNLKGHIIFGFW